MELRHLRYFVAVAEELHFRRAAERLHVSQPPLSQQIKALEDEVGVRLLTRTSRHVELTDAGRTFLQLARRTIAEAEHATEAARRVARGELGWLRLGFVDSAAYELLPQMLRTFHARYPDVRLDVRELPTEVQLDLIGSELDLGIVRDPRLEEDSPLTVTPLVREPLLAVLPDTHRLAKTARIELSDLAGEPFVMVSRAGTPTVHDHIVALCLRAGFSPHTVEEALQYSSILGLVAADYGVAVVPACVTLLRFAGVAYVPLDDPDAVSVLALVTSTGDTSPTVDSFLRTMSEVLRL
jgi:DNA-binding transcriptional LysR family regulator